MMNIQSMVLFIFILLETLEIVKSIQNGNTTIGDDFTYHVILWHDASPICGGVIIDEWHILTAGHCVYNQLPPFLVEPRTNNVSNVDFNRRVEKVYLHDQYIPSFTATKEQLLKHEVHHPGNDIAVLRVKYPLPLEGGFQAIPLPTSDIDYCYDYTDCKVAGWGRTDRDTPSSFQVFSWAYAPILEPFLCDLLRAPHRDNEICTFDRRGKTTLQKGDSGGGLVCNGILVGIVSAISGYLNSPVIHTNVFRHRSFINDAREKKQVHEEPINKKKRTEDDL